MQIRQIAAIALILAGAVACTGGGSDGTTSAPTPTLPPSSTTPTTALPTTASTSATPPPTVATTGPNVRPGEKPPTLNAVGLRNSPVGADTYARYWMSTIDWSYATMSTSLARSTFSPSCVDCKRLLDYDIDALTQKGQHYEGGRIAVTDSTIQPNVAHNGSTAIVDIVVDQGALKVEDRHQKVIERVANTGRVTFRTWLRYSAKGWSVVDWKHVIVR